MTLAEKLACEWEARHDVTARGRVADPAPVQHYLSHVRVADGSHPHAARSAHPPAAQRSRDASVPPALRGWLRWGDDGR
jgi:hypothetical protein